MVMDNQQPRTYCTSGQGSTTNMCRTKVCSKWRASEEDGDIVWTLWRHKEVHKRTA